MAIPMSMLLTALLCECCAAIAPISVPASPARPALPSKHRAAVPRAAVAAWRPRAACRRWWTVAPARSAPPRACGAGVGRDRERAKPAPALEMVADGALPELPAFSWRTVLFFALNPAATLPLPLLAACAFHFDVLGPSFALDGASALAGLALTAPLLMFQMLPLERVRGLESLLEATTASKVICLYALGGKLVPLRAALAACMLSASAAVCEELAFRGVVMSVAQALATRALSPAAATTAALSLQALIFGKLHSYTESRAYFLMASFVGACFGGAYAATRNIFVPILMHFVLDLISFLTCHVQVARATDEQKRELELDDSPIGRMLRETRALLEKRPTLPEAKAVVAETSAPEG